MFLIGRESLMHQFLALGYFSRLCILLLSGAVLWSVTSVARLATKHRRRRATVAADASAAAAIRLAHLKLNGIYYVSELLAVACIADLLFSFIAIYMERGGTDADPYPVLFQAWNFSRLIFLTLLLIHALRWYVSTIFAGHIESSAPDDNS